MSHTFSLSSMHVKLEQLETMNNNKNKNILQKCCDFCVWSFGVYLMSLSGGALPAVGTHQLLTPWSPWRVSTEDSLCGESPPTFAAQAGLFTQPPGPRNACTLQPCPGTYRLIGDLHLVSQDVCVFHQETGKLWQVVKHP